MWEPPAAQTCSNASLYNNQTHIPSINALYRFSWLTPAHIMLEVLFLASSGSLLNFSMFVWILTHLFLSLCWIGESGIGHRDKDESKSLGRFKSNISESPPTSLDTCCADRLHRSTALKLTWTNSALDFRRKRLQPIDRHYNATTNTMMLQMQCGHVHFWLPPNLLWVITNCLDPIYNCV